MLQTFRSAALRLGSLSFFLLALSLVAQGAANSANPLAPGGRRKAPTASSTVAARARATRLRFEVSLGPGMKQPITGRLLIALGAPNRGGEPRLRVSDASPGSAPVLGRDVTLRPGQIAVVDRAAASFPLPSLDALPPGQYRVQALLMRNRDLLLPDAPGNLYSSVISARLDVSAGSPAVVRLQLSQQLPPEAHPPPEPRLRWVKMLSPRLSAFWKRPMYLRAGVVLPPGFEADPARRYPLRVHIGGFGTRYTAARFLAETDADAPRILTLHLDGAGPLGDPYQVNSANHGPYGDAVTQELIPFVERKFRAIGTSQARFVDGGSTGGWVSFALQVFYPDFFNGCWSGFPDPLDFRAYQLIDIYKNRHAYKQDDNSERPSMRSASGEVLFTIRQECRMENVKGTGDSYTLGGGQWGAWNATFGARGKDGRPVPLWNSITGEIDTGTLDQWRKYDLRLVMERNWKTLGPKLRGKIHLWVGEADEYYLNTSVHLMDDFLRRASPPAQARVLFGPGQGHGWMPLSQRQIAQEMLAAYALSSQPPRSP